VITGGIEERNRAAGISVDAIAITPRWYGDPLDLGHMTTKLWCVHQRQRPPRNSPADPRCGDPATPVWT
jgi:hypothetical protein